MLEGDSSNSDIAEFFDVGMDVVKKIRNGVSWKDVSCNYNIRTKAPRGKYTESQIKKVCELINEGLSNKEIEIITNGELKASLAKSVKAKKSYKFYSDKYLKV